MAETNERQKGEYGPETSQGRVDYYTKVFASLQSSAEVIGVHEMLIAVNEQPLSEEALDRLPDTNPELAFEVAKAAALGENTHGISFLPQLLRLNQEKTVGIWLTATDKGAAKGTRISAAVRFVEGVVKDPEFIRAIDPAILAPVYAASGGVFREYEPDIMPRLSF